ncbi:SapC family protein [Halomonas shantousis]
MASFVPVSRERHAQQHWLPQRGYEFAAHQAVVPIVFAELSQTIKHFPLGFVQQGEHYQLVALTGLSNERNLYVNHDGRWLAGYVPAALRGHPFALGQGENDQWVLCVNESMTLEAADQGEAFFDDQGEPARRVRETFEFLQQRERNRRLTDQACRLLGELGVVEPWPLKVETDDKPLTLNGLHRINETALNALEGDAFLQLRRAGALPLAYAQLLSMQQLSQLTERARYLANQTPMQNEDFSFGEGDDELRFDFDS